MVSDLDLEQDLPKIDLGKGSPFPRWQRSNNLSFAGSEDVLVARAILTLGGAWPILITIPLSVTAPNVI